MNPSYHEMDMLARLMHSEKLSKSLKKKDVERSKTQEPILPHDLVPCRVRPTRVAAK